MSIIDEVIIMYCYYYCYKSESTNVSEPNELCIVFAGCRLLALPQSLSPPIKDYLFNLFMNFMGSDK